MKREFLKALSLSDDVIDQIMGENGRDVEAVKARFSDYGEVKNRLEEADAQLQAFRDMDIDGLKKTADDWQKKAQKAEATAQQSLERLRFEYALDAALSAAKVKNIKAVKALLDMDALALAGDKIAGLNEQIESLKADNGYLFENTDKAPRVAGPTKGASRPADASLRSAFGLPPARA